MDREILNLIPKNRSIGIDFLLKKLILKRIDINLFKFNGFWTDIGNEEDYFNLNKLLKSKKISFLF